jgi:hypothetical protein
VNPVEREKWEKIRAIGYVRYLILNGIVLTNLFITGSAAIGVLAGRLLFHSPSSELPDEVPGFWFWCVAIVSVCGLLRAGWDWRKNEKKYKGAN